MVNPEVGRRMDRRRANRQAKGDHQGSKTIMPGLAPGMIFVCAGWLSPAHSRERGNPASSLNAGTSGTVAHHPHNCLLAMAAPSLSDLNFAHTMLGWISFEPANVAKPQSVPAMTFPRPTTLA